MRDRKRRWGEQVAQSEGSHLPVHAGTSGVQHWDTDGGHVVPSVRSRAWEGLAARNANNVSCRLQVLMCVWTKQSNETTVCADVLDVKVCAYVAASQLHTKTISEREQ